MGAIVPAAASGAHPDAFIATRATDLHYLTGFTGEDSIGLVLPESAVLLTDSRFEEQLAAECPTIRPVIRSGERMHTAVARALAECQVKVAAFDPAHTTVQQLHDWQAAVTETGHACDFVAVAEPVTKLRQVKDAHEIVLLRKAVWIAEEGCRQLRPYMKADGKTTEAGLAGRLVQIMRELGAEGSSFPVIMASGSGSSLPHYRAAAVKIADNQTLLMDWGALYHGYHSDLTRTFFVGKPVPEILKIYGIVLAAMEKSIAALRPGLSTKAADLVARDLITEAGYGPRFGHSLGHGIGLDIHEGPGLRSVGVTGDGDPLLPGMVVTVEPGIYLPGIGGVRLEQDVLITETGHEVLGNLDVSLKLAQL